MPKDLTTVTGWLTVTVGYHHIQFQNINQWERNLLVRKAKLPQRVMSTKSKAQEGCYWPSNLTFLLVHILSWIHFSKCMQVLKKSSKTYPTNLFSHRQGQDSKHLTGVNHSACHTVEVKSVRTSRGEDLHMPNSQSISVLFKLLIGAKSGVQVIFSSQYI